MNETGVKLELTLRVEIKKNRKLKQRIIFIHLSGDDRSRVFRALTLLSETFPSGFLKKEVLAVKKYSSESSSKLL